MKNVVLSTKNIDDFVSDVANEVIRKIELWKGKEQNSKKDPDQLLTCKETEKLLSIDPSTRVAWTNKGKIKGFGIGSRRYYKRSQLMEALIPLKK